MEAFPAIRAPLKESWRGAEPDGVKRTPMDEGPEKTRLTSTAVGGREAFQFRLPKADAITLRGFYAANKALRFTLDHWVWGACEANFAGPIRWGARGALITAELELNIYFAESF